MTVRLIRRMSVKDYAQVTGRSRRTINKMCEDKRMPGAIKNASGHWEIDVDAAKAAKFRKRGRPTPAKEAKR
jgi:predicted DNA-binding transcriptional regulator AlpA